MEWEDGGCEVGMGGDGKGDRSRFLGSSVLYLFVLGCCTSVSRSCVNKVIRSLPWFLNIVNDINYCILLRTVAMGVKFSETLQDLATFK